MTLDTGRARRDAPAAPRRTSTLRKAIGIGWFGLLVVALGLALRSRWSDVAPQLADLEVWRLVTALAVALVGVGASSGIWHAMLLGIGERLPVAASLRIFFVGQIGKYLPGSVWPAVTQAALARAHGVAPRAAVTAVTLFLWVHIVTAVAVGVGILAAVGQLPRLALAAVPFLLVLLWPRGLRWALERLLRLARREPLRQLPNGRHLAQACAWALVMWVCYGLHLQILTAATGEPVGLMTATGVFALAWVLGFALLVAPAGVGPREAAMVALLPIGGAGALLVALLSRLVLTIVDAVWAAATAVGPGRLPTAVEVDERVDQPV